ncbi:efflux RND transporter periplasmic adaptor subunit [Candidatus Manganitrophus noduliformans]|uniref:Efflux RND transporter periplasmic adaptor subunit n=1 Tax=Candidatus Manganitrophus noduliformans TaxID=2606439 RepID=A0A7X6IAQ7_9BACT|nr:efflux RND transporter periplasmic adaptor subunit [Candidatus Manganitrophus noduliformans]NKE70731.1 efflux RND transporter periplasmic adaptor subunit [Candidatus Manganitrophus noduliformans]
MALFREWKKGLLGVAALVAIIAGVTLFRGGEKAAEYRTAKVEQGEITTSVSATGRVDAVVTVEVGSQVSGRVQKLFADFNSRVEKGQVVAQIDPSLFEAQVEQARAKLANDEANTEKARVLLADAKRALKRMETLFARDFVSESEKEAAQSAHDSAVANLKAAETQIAQDRASLKLVEENLRYATILSPVDGIVISRNVSVGQTVAASLQAPTLFTIAQDLMEMKVDTSVDEADIGRVAIGQEAEFTVDAYPDTPFRGTVQDIYNQPVVLQNVVTYAAIIRVKNPELKLRPGMTANVTIRVAHKENVLKLPNAALRYRPEGESGRSVPVKKGGGRTTDVWVLREGKELAVPVTLGLSDGSFTEVLSGDLKPGDRVITERLGGATSAPGGRRAPSMRF